MLCTTTGPACPATARLRSLRMMLWMKRNDPRHSRRTRRCRPRLSPYPRGRRCMSRALQRRSRLFRNPPRTQLAHKQTYTSSRRLVLHRRREYNLEASNRIKYVTKQTPPLFYTHGSSNLAATGLVGGLGGGLDVVELLDLLRLDPRLRLGLGVVVPVQRDLWAWCGESVWRERRASV